MSIEGVSIFRSCKELSKHVISDDEVEIVYSCKINMNLLGSDNMFKIVVLLGILSLLILMMKCLMAKIYTFDEPMVNNDDETDNDLYQRFNDEPQEKTDV